MSRPTEHMLADPVTASFFSAVRQERPRTCRGGVAPSFDAAKTHWREALPGFWIPATWVYDAARWPDYTPPDAVTQLLDAPEITDIVHVAGIGQPAPREWAAWLGSHGCDTTFRGSIAQYGAIADRLYGSSRTKYLIPAWRRALLDVVQELDDIEDQVSTILWLVETVLRKIIPIPPGVMSGAHDIQRALDKAERLLATGNPGRGAKAEYAARQRELTEARRTAKTTHAKLIVWLRDNWGKLLEAAQATDTWADVGLSLGPIMGYIENGSWELARHANDGYWYAIDAAFPGSRDAYMLWAERTTEQIESAIAGTIENVTSWTTDAMTWALTPATPVDNGTPAPQPDTADPWYWGGGAP